jgi:hypothetical protein
MGEYRYLAAIVGVILAEYAVFWIIFALLKINGKLPLELFDKSIKDSGSSWLKLGSRELNEKYHVMDVVLLLYRIVAFGWLGVFATIVGLSVFFPSSWHYYTLWNLMLISLYFLLAIASSICHLTKAEQTLSQGRAKWLVVTLGKAVGGCFGFVASSALMVTVLNFMLLNPTPTFWNITQHLTQLVGILIEFSLNGVRVNPQELLLAISWPMLYLVFIWPIVKTDVREWPYYFLEVSKPGAFVWYHILFLACVVFFFIVYGLDKLKWGQIDKRNAVVKPQDSVAPNCIDSTILSADINHPL